MSSTLKMEATRSIITDIGSAVGSKNNFGLTGHHQLRSSPWPQCVCTVLMTSAIFFKCIPEVMFCKSVQHRLRFCLYHLNCVKMVIFQFYLQSEKQIKVGWVGDDSHVAFGQKLPSEKASSFVTKVWDEVFAHFHEVVIKRYSSMQN
jgi:hypothetical protein